jgi:hypothetical protein
MAVLQNAAESNRASVRAIKEVVWGTTPASGVSRELRITESGLVPSKETKVSEEIRADRMVPSVIEVGAASGGSIAGEFSAGTFDDFMEAFLLGAWTKAMNFLVVKGRSVSITANNTVRLSGTDYTGQIANGQWFKLEGFVNPANNGYFQVSGAPSFTAGNTVITVVGTPLVVASGSAYTKFLDASDVILVSTLTAFEAANTINGGGANAFAGLTLRVGQKIYTEGLGKGSGEILCNAANPPEGSTITISDGVDTVIFEARTDADLVDQNHVHVALSDTPLTFAANIVAAIMDQFIQQKLRVSAVTDGVDTVTLTQHRGAGGSIAASDDATSVTVTDFTGGDNTKHGLFTVASLPDDDTIVTEETLGVDANGGGLLVVIKGSHLRNSGTLSEIVKQSFTIETGFNDVEKYIVQNGMRIGSFSKKVAVGEIVTFEFELQGRQTIEDVTPLLSESPYTVLPTTATEIFNATSNVGSMKKDGETLALSIMSIDIEGDNNLRQQKAVGEKFPAGIGYGRFSLTGKLVAYFETFEFFQHFLDHDTISLAYSFTDADHNHYVETIPALKITSDPISPKGIDQDVMEEMDWVAQRDPVLNTQYMLDRFSSLYPMSDA